MFAHPTCFVVHINIETSWLVQYSLKHRSEHRDSRLADMHRERGESRLADLVQESIVTCASQT